MDLILLFPIMRGHILLHPFIIRRGIVDQLTVFREARAVAGAIPGMLDFVVFESATEVWTSGRGGCKKPNGRLKSVALKHKVEVETAEAKALAAKLDSLLIKITASSGADGRLYGSITAKDIADALAKNHGITVDKRKIQLSDAIRAYGKYDLDVKLYTDIVGKIHVLVCN